MVVAGGAGTALVLARGRVARAAHASTVRVLLIRRRVARCASRPAILVVTETAVITVRVLLANPLTLGCANHARGLRRSSFDLVCRQLFQVSNARLESFDALPFPYVARGALMVVLVVDAAVTRGAALRAPRLRREVVVRAVACGRALRPSATRREIRRLVVLRVVHLFASARVY